MSPVRIVCVGCERCAQQDHHWLADIDTDGEPIFACKHCDATKPIHFDTLEGCTVGADIGRRGGDSTAVALVRIDDSGQQVIQGIWRSCIWCKGNVPHTRKGGTCGRQECEKKEAAWQLEHPDAGPREQITIENERYL